MNMNKAYLLLGSNMGHPAELLEKAIHHIQKNIGKVYLQSSLYKTAPWGKTDQPDFINQVIAIQTKLSADATMKAILAIEEDMGRIRTEKNAPRFIDIDILFFNDNIISSDLVTVPHPRIQDRKFVLIPMNEIAPTLTHPVLHKNIRTLLAACTDPLDVNKI